MCITLKKTLLIVWSAIILIACLSLGIVAADTDLSVYVTAQVEGESANILPSKNIFYLSSAIDVTKLSIASEKGDVTYSANGGAYNGTVKSGETLDLTPAKTKDERGADCYKLTLTVNGKSEDYVFYSDSSINTVFVTTSKGLSYINSSKSNRDKGSKILAVSEDGKIEYSDFSGESTSEIKLRGNATSSYYKRPYQIKLGSKTKLFGMDKSKTWILLANYTDQSFLHNALAFTMGGDINIPFNIDYRFTNLYVDGEYLGLYMICEKVQVDSSRVDIEDLEEANEEANPGVDFENLSQKVVDTGSLVQNSIIKYYTYIQDVKSPSDITGGYLIELDTNYGNQEPSHFVTENGNTYVVKSPEYASKEEVEYIAGLFADMEEAIYSDTGYNKKGKHYSEYIDMESFSGVYTIQELMKNWDAYTSSVFFYKDADQNGEQSKIYCGPLWDLDNTLGNINYNNDFGLDTAYLWAQFGNFGGYHRGFAKNLMEHEDFQKVTAEIYSTLYAKVQDYLSENGWLQQESEKIYSSVMMDRTRWKSYDSNSWLLTAYGYKSKVKFVHFVEYGAYNDTDSTTALGFLRYYLSSRADALQESIGTIGIDPPTKTEPPVQTTTTIKVTTSKTTATTKVTVSTTVPAVTTTDTTATSSSATTSPQQTEKDPSYFPVVLVCVIVAAVGTCLGMLTMVFINRKKK